MSYPFFPPFKTRTLEVSSTSTGGSVLQVAVPARAKLVGVVVAYGGNISQTGPNTGNLDITLTPYNTSVGSTAIGQIACTTSTAGSVVALATTAVVYCNQGDILSAIPSTLACPSVTFILQEF